MECLRDEELKVGILGVVKGNSAWIEKNIVVNKEGLVVAERTVSKHCRLAML